MNLLTYAVIYNQPVIVFLLLQLNIDVNIQDNVKKFTPLMYSIVFTKSILITKMLLKHGADTSIKDIVFFIELKVYF